MLEEKEIEISSKISKKDAGKKFLLKQVPATRMKKLLFECQDIYRYDGDGNVSVNTDKKEQMYFNILAEISYKFTKDGNNSLYPLKKNEIDAFIEDVNTLDYLVNEFVKLNLGEEKSLVTKSLANLAELR